MNPGFWKGKKIFITGHTGFKGSWLCNWLKLLGSEITGYSLAPPTNPNLFELTHADQGINHIISDIRDFDRLQQELEESKPEIIIHLAAQALVRHSYENPMETWSTNLMGTANLLEVARQCDSVKTILVITTDKCYLNKESIWGYRETDALGGHDPYSASKACAEFISASYSQSYFSNHGVSLATARAGNVIGGGDWGKDRLIVDIINSVNNNTLIDLRYPQAVRPWQYVLDPLRGYLTLLEAMWENPEPFSEAWNFGPDSGGEMTVLEITQSLYQLWDKEYRFNNTPENSHPHETTQLRLDATKAKRYLNWNTRYSVPRTLESIHKWYSAWQKGMDMQSVTLDQIMEFQNA